MKMCFHGNRVSWGINHPLISLYSKYQPPSFICSSIMLAPVISSLDEIYCTRLGLEPYGWDRSYQAGTESFEAGVGAFGIEWESWGSNWNFEAGIDASRLGLEAKIWALMPGGGRGGKISHNCESIGQWPLWSRCTERGNQLTCRSTKQPVNQTKDQPTDRQTRV